MKIILYVLVLSIFQQFSSVLRNLIENIVTLRTDTGTITLIYKILIIALFFAIFSIIRQAIKIFVYAYELRLYKVNKNDTPASVAEKHPAIVDLATIRLFLVEGFSLSLYTALVNVYFVDVLQLISDDISKILCFTSFYLIILCISVCNNFIGVNLIKLWLKYTKHKKEDIYYAQHEKNFEYNVRDLFDIKTPLIYFEEILTRYSDSNHFKELFVKAIIYLNLGFIFATFFHVLDICRIHYFLNISTLSSGVKDLFVTAIILYETEVIKSCHKYILKALSAMKEKDIISNIEISFNKKYDTTTTD